MEFSTPPVSHHFWHHGHIKVLSWLPVSISDKKVRTKHYWGQINSYHKILPSYRGTNVCSESKNIVLLVFVVAFCKRTEILLFNVFIWLRKITQFYSHSHHYIVRTPPKSFPKNRYIIENYLINHKHTTPKMSKKKNWCIK